MKNLKIVSLLSLLCGVLTLSSCSIIREIIEYDDQEENTQRDDIDFNIDKVDVDGKTIIQHTYKDVAKNSVYTVDYCPNSGDVKLLIIPVWFSDSNSYIISDTSRQKVREDIKTAYLGSVEETGWHSVKTYYEKESSYKLTIEGTVSEWYEPGISASQVSKNGDVTNALVTTAVDWYFSTHDENKSNYDSDNNGYLDGVMLIYAAPDYRALNNDEYDNLWAYCNWLQMENDKSYPIPNVYFWASYDFMYSEGMKARDRAGTSYGSGKTTHCKIDAHTYIHEMGHVFGLDDYYDYGDNRYNPAGGFSMQDFNVGGHDPYSVMSLGWANPYVVSDNAKVSIGTFQKTRDVVLLSSNWNGIGSPFDEYLLFELYSPTGLNELDSRFCYEAVQGPNLVGIRVWHVDARLTYCNELQRVGIYNQPVFRYGNFTSDPKVGKENGNYGLTVAFTNTVDKEDYGSVFGPDYDDYNILQLVRNSKTAKIRNKDYISSRDLFTTGSYALSDFSSQFVKGRQNKMNNDSYFDWKFKITITGIGEDSRAEIEIIK